MPTLVSIFLFMGSTKVAIIRLQGVGDIALKLYYSFSQKIAITRTAMLEKCSKLLSLMAHFLISSVNVLKQVASSSSIMSSDTA